MSMYNSDSEHYNDNYDYDRDEHLNHSSDLYSYKCNYQDSDDDNSGSGTCSAAQRSRRSMKTNNHRITTSQKKQVRKIKRSVPVKMHESIIKKNFLRTDVYCLKCGQRTKSYEVTLVRDSYQNAHRYRLTRMCVKCNSKGCKFLNTATVDGIIHGNR